MWRALNAWKITAIYPKFLNWKVTIIKYKCGSLPHPSYWEDKKGQEKLSTDLLTFLALDFPEAWLYQREQKKGTRRHAKRNWMVSHWVGVERKRKNIRGHLELFKLGEKSEIDFTYIDIQMVNAQIRLIIFFAAKDEEALYSQQEQDQEQTMAQIISSLLQNSGSNWIKYGKPLGHSGMT